MSPVRTNRRKPIAFAFIICICLITGGLLAAKGYLTIEWANAQLDTLEEILNRPYGPALYVSGTVTYELLQLPGVVPVFLGPLVYDLWAAFLISAIGINIGLVATFLIARYFLRDYFAPKLKKSRLNRLARHLETNGILVMIFLRLILWMNPAMNRVIATTNIRIRDYIIGNIIRTCPGYLCPPVGHQETSINPFSLGLVAAGDHCRDGRIHCLLARGCMDPEKIFLNERISIP